MFEGFNEKTVDFMWNIRFNNEKAWFEANKEDYLTHFYRPMRALSEEVYDRFLEGHKDCDLTHKVSRIYRDARRLHGQGLYKDKLWCSMERPSEDWTGDPVFWFELAPEGYSYGLGYYYARPLTMAKFRARLDKNPKSFEALVRRFNKQSEFVLDGEDYKRPKGETSSLLAPWYNKKGFSLIHRAAHDERLFSHGLADCLVAGYESLYPFYQYLISLDGDPDPRT